MMKKIILLAIAALLVMTANAQLKRSATPQVPARPQMQLVKPQAKMEVAQMRTPGTPVTKKASDRAQNHGIWYRRPAGAFPASIIVEDGARAAIRFAPYIAMTPYVNYSFTGMSDPEYFGASYEWDVQYWGTNDIGDNEKLWETVPGMGENGMDLTWQWGYETADVPVFKMTSPEYMEFTLKGYKMSGTSASPIIDEEHISNILSVPSTMEIWDCDYLKSSKNFACGGLNGDQYYTTIYYSGAQPYPGNESGWWFGKNGYHNMDNPRYFVDGIAQAFEKPTAPYLLKQVVLETALLEVAAPVEMTCRIYKLEEIPPYLDDESAILPEEPGELMAIGRAILTPETDANTGGLVFFTLFGEEDGIEKTITPTIDCAILVVIDGYNDPSMANLHDFSAMISSDFEWDEGFGELAYLKYAKANENGNPESYYWRGLNNFFSGGTMTMMTGLSIYLSTENPYLIFNKENEDGKYHFPNRGGIMVKQFDDCTTRSIEFLSWTPSESGDWTLTWNGGKELPDWLSIELEDFETNNRGTVVNAKVIASPLPSGVTGRGAVIRFNIPGNYIDYKFVQGDVDPDAPVDAIYNFVVDGIYYVITGDNEVSVTFRDKNYKTYSGEIVIPSEVTYDGVTYAVTGIAGNAFKSCNNLLSLTIPVSVTSIGANAFVECSLNTVCITGNGDWRAGALPGTVQSLYIGSGVTSIVGLNVNPTTIYSYSSTPPVCNEMTFMGYDGTLHIPAASIASYFIADYWCNFFDVDGDAVEPLAITMSQDSLELALYGQTMLTTTINPSNATPSTVSWQSTNKAIATVENGQVRAVAKGECDIVATCVGMQAVCHVTVVEIMPSSLTLSQDSATMEVGDQLSLTATVLPEDVTNKTVVWSSTDYGIAAVYEGVITAIAPGQCDIIARCGNVSDTCHVMVADILPSSLTLSHDSVSMDIGEQISLTATVLPEDATNKTVVWSSTDNGVATVNEGVVTAIAPGVCDIIARCGNVGDTCHVTVVEKIIYITLDQHEVSVLPNHIITLTPTMTPEATNLKVTSSNPSVAAARLANGKVQVVGINEGETTVYVGSVDGTAVGDTCHVTVYTELGDVNCDGYINITDVTVLINYLLSGDDSVVNITNADTNNDNRINISDVTTLIKYLLSGEWTDRDLIMHTPVETVGIQEVIMKSDDGERFILD